jgi:hypothetical protein
MKLRDFRQYFSAARVNRYCASLTAFFIAYKHRIIELVQFNRPINIFVGHVKHRQTYRSAHTVQK